MTSRADVLIVNARPWSDGHRLAACDAVAIQGSRILAIGSGADLEPLRGPATRVLDARGASLTPGLEDAHLHLVAWSRALREVQLDGLATRRAAVAAVAQRASQLGVGTAPLIGRGWAETGWEAAPEHAALDHVVPQRPVLLHSKDYHALWVNNAAMAAAGVHRGTADPDGGKIERTPAGEPTGVFRENAVRLFDPLIARPTVREDLDGVRDAVRRLLAMGVTAVHDFEGDAEADVLKALVTGDGPRVRVLMHLPRLALDRALSEGLPPADDDFAWGALKLFADGTLGSRTAHLLEPYDDSEEMGLPLMSPDELKGVVGRAVRGGLSVAIHAIGDRAVRSALDAFEDCGPALDRLSLRPRVEHAQLVHDDDRSRFARLGVVASMQPIHCTADRPLVERFWGGRVRRSYPWRTLLDDGAQLAFGSDAPVEWPSPARGLHAAVTREAADRPRDPFVPMQRIALDEALTAYTRLPAQLAGAWPGRGRLAPGALADLVIWDVDLHRIPAAELHRAAPAFTLLDGVVRFEAILGGEGVAVGARREGD